MRRPYGYADVSVPAQRCQNPNRTTQITANLKVVKKTDCIKSLQALEEGGDLVVKTFGKQLVYCAKQVCIGCETS